jgi:predicted RNA-binding protein with RPS1 domain
MPFGALCEIGSEYRDGLLGISKYDCAFAKSDTDRLYEGQQICVKVIEVMYDGRYCLDIAQNQEVSRVSLYRARLRKYYPRKVNELCVPKGSILGYLTLLRAKRETDSYLRKYHSKNRDGKPSAALPKRLRTREHMLAVREGRRAMREKLRRVKGRTSASAGEPQLAE